ncbi:MAG: TetR/AcrR family transcriptional regulator [Acidimicrobiales bacterium]
MDGTSVVRRPPFGANPLVGERGSDTQKRILAAALDVFAEVGYNDTRVELITERAGCSRPAFYQYFSSKDDVFWKLAGQLGKEMVALGDQLGVITPDADGVDALAAWINDFTTLYGRYSPVFEAFQAASRDHKPMARGSSSISERMGSALLRAFEAEDDPDGTTAHLATGLVAVLIRCSFYWENMAGALPRERVIRGLAELVHRLFEGPIDGVNLERSRGARSQPAKPPSAATEATDHGRALRPRGERTRQRLLAAGAKVLPARGYHDARVDDIVEVAGVSHGSFYRYFANKDDFFRALAEAASTRMIELLDEFPMNGDTATLQQWFEVWFTTYGDNGGVISTWQEMQGADPELISFSQHVGASVIAQLMVVLEARNFGDSTVDALALLALIERLPYSVFTLRFTKQSDAIDAMVTIYQRGFLGLGVPA